MADEKPNVFGRLATKVDTFFQDKYYKIGSCVGKRPCLSIGLSLLFVVVLAGGISQVKSESRPDKLWIPQGTWAQEDEAVYNQYFPPTSRFNTMILEAKGSQNALSREFLAAAIQLHEKIEAVQSGGDNLTSLCVQMPADGHPCFIQSILGTWNYNSSILSADANPLATLNSQGMSQEDMRRFLGMPEFSGNQLTSARALRLSYYISNNQEVTGGEYVDARGEAWEEKVLELMKCDSPRCDGSVCVCDYDSDVMTIYPQLQRSFSDAFGSVIQGDVMLINLAFLIMIIYLIINLGGAGHKVRSRALLAFGSVICIVLGGAAGYGLSMWMQFKYTPVHSVLPFVILGIGVDDSFVIMNALDRTDPSLAVPERIAQAISHAGVSIMVTSLTDFVALLISVSSALPALSSFCMYAAVSVLFLFVLQISLFTALATWDTYRVNKGRIDCCFCLPRGCPCCKTVAMEEAAAAVERGEKDPNQMCCSPPKHQGGLVGKFLENIFGPVLVRPPVAMGVCAFFLIFCGICTWQATQLGVQDTQRNFIPDDSYVAQGLLKTDEYFSNLGTSVYLMTGSGDYFASQQALNDIGTRLGSLSSVQSTTGDAFRSWAASFRAACQNGMVGSPVTIDANGFATVSSQYYTGLATWLAGAGSKYRNDVVWADMANPQAGISAARISFELAPMMTEVGDKMAVDASRAIEAMDQLRQEVDSWSDMPGQVVMFSRNFLIWETFRIIQREMLLSVGLCLLAVFVITLGLIAHPLTALLVLICVLMTIVDLLGCLNMIGVAIDNVSVIQVVIAVGFCVDYSAHVGHNFMMQSGSLQERVTATLGNVGAAVLNGGISTLLATVLLGFSKSYVFRVLFYSFFLTIFTGLLHGMVLLPALLSLIGPASYGGGSGHSQKTKVDSPGAEDTKAVGS